MKLSSLLNNVPVVVLSTFPELFQDPEITGVAFDSRRVLPGNVFVALEGFSMDGHQYISDAIQKGARAVIGMKPFTGLSVPYIQLEDSRKALAYLCSNWYENPASKMRMIGVTGTDGKTTTTNLIESILNTAGIKVGMISTVNAMISGRAIDTGFHVTTPDAPDMQFYLSEMVKAGATHAVVEATSHGLKQHRADACEFDLAVVTNITHEHLDFHGSYENYLEAKGLLFSSLALTRSKMLGNLRIGVINRDDHSWDYLSSLPGFTPISYGLGPDADVTAEVTNIHPSGMDILVSGRGMNLPIHSHLIGGFNVSNILAAVTAAVQGLGIDPEAAAQGVEALKGIPGRMEFINMGQDFTALVDFAHTPHALEAAIQSARAMNPKRVITVFGSAGLRDRAKRRMMAKTAVEQADISFFTAEDPRTESLDDILSEMADEAKKNGGIEGRSFYRVGDRREAIRQAVHLAQPGDLVMSCGKGHEQSMCFGTTEYPWDDRIAMRAALSELLRIAGYEMPFLPTV